VCTPRRRRARCRAAPRCPSRPSCWCTATGDRVSRAARAPLDPASSCHNIEDLTTAALTTCCVAQVAAPRTHDSQLFSDTPELIPNVKPRLPPASHPPP
jgi:hypothetical protein